MKTNFSVLVVILILFISSMSFSKEDDDWIIIPGVKVGRINANTKEADLLEIYGKENVKSTAVEVGEGATIPGTILFPGQPEKQLEITWKNEKEKSEPLSVILRGRHSLWKTKDGISLGTSLKEIEVLNGKPFQLTGFGWDYSGTIYTFNGGILCGSGYCDEVDKGIIKRKKIFIRLDPKVNHTDKKQLNDYETLQGDKIFSSDNPVMNKLNPLVYEIIITLNEPAPKVGKKKRV